MADKKLEVSDADIDQSILEKVNNFVDSPIKLFVFCTALLLISLTTGMLVGNAVQDMPPAAVMIVGTQADTTAERDIQTVEATEEKNNQSVIIAENQKKQAIDALDYDPKGALRNEGINSTANSDRNEGEDGTETASLPPQKDNLIPPPWKRYAAMSTPSNGRPVIAMVIDDVGINKRRVKALAQLPNIVTLAFLPYATGLNESVQIIREQGHEALLHLPMEPMGEGADPGPNALLSSLSLQEIRKRTIENLRRFDGYVGVNNHMGSKFTAFEPGMATVMDVLSEEGLLFLDSRTTSGSKGFELAKARNLPTANRDVFIDNEINEVSILTQLKEVEALSLKNGIAIAIGHPHLETISALTKWMPKAVEKGFHFVPISVALTRNLER